MAKQLTTEEIIRRFIEVHGYRFNYSKVVYLGIFIKGIIICPEHGEFLQSPSNHLKGKGCPRCKFEKLSKDRLSNLIEFTFKSKEVHGDRYGYKNFIYTDSSTKSYVTCEDHGDFLVSPNNHLRGKGCPICFGNQLLTLEEFIRRAIIIHGYRFDYSKVVYINSWSKVIIICPIHGEFEQTPAAHLVGKGCNKCAGFNKTTEEFIQEAIEIHGNKYRYYDTIYKGAHIKSIFNCEKHGDFEQTPDSHLRGSGCPSCKSSKGELAIKTILDKYGIEAKQEWKIPEVVANYEYDFYLPQLNILIEFHGEQHYKYIPHFHRKGEDQFLANKNTDDVKKDNAYRFKYRFLEFNYLQLKHMTKEQFEELVISKINFQQKRKVNA